MSERLPTIPEVEIEETEPYDDELCKKKSRVDVEDEDEDDATVCRVCFMPKNTDPVVRNCSWSEHHWVHAACHAELVKHRHHVRCNACRVPTKFVAFETTVIQRPNTRDQIRERYLDLHRYIPLSCFRDDLFEILCRDAENKKVVTHTILPYECVPLDTNPWTGSAPRKYRHSVNFARDFASSSIIHKIFQSEDADLIVGFLRRYYYLLLAVELSDSLVCANRIMHHVLCIKSFEVMRPVIVCLRDELGYNVTQTPVLEHVATKPHALEDWASVQRVYDCLGTSLACDEAREVASRWSLKPAILRHLLHFLIEHRANVAGIWTDYLMGQVAPFPGHEVETWTVLADLARPPMWYSGSWDKQRIPEEVWSKYRPEYTIPGCIGSPSMYPISKPQETMLYRWDKAWADCSVIFCHERGLPAEEMDRVLECKWICVIRDPLQGLLVMGAHTDEKFPDAKTRAEVEQHLATLNPPPIELLRLGVAETARVRIKYSVMVICELDEQGKIMRRMS